jgi:hypothetical protein
MGNFAEGAIVFLPAEGAPIWSNQLDFRTYWAPGQSTLTLCVEDFMDSWNRALVSPERGGQLAQTRDGNLVLSAIDGLPGETMFLYGDSKLWWNAMGFSEVALPTDSDIVAESLPLNDMKPLERIWSGTELQDFESPCNNPNAPLSPPEFVGYNIEF